MGLGSTAWRTWDCCLAARQPRQNGRGPLCLIPLGLRRRLLTAPALSPHHHIAFPKPCQGWHNWGPKPTPWQAVDILTVPGRQLGWLGGQRSAVSCPVEIRRKQRRVKDPGSSGMSSCIRQKAGVSSPFLPVHHSPAYSPCPYGRPHNILSTLSASKLVLEKDGASKAEPGLEPDPQMTPCQCS